MSFYRYLNLPRISDSHEALIYYQPIHKDAQSILKAIRRDILVTRRHNTPILWRQHMDSHEIVWNYFFKPQLEPGIIDQRDMEIARYAHDWGKLHHDNKGKNHRKVSLKLMEKEFPELLNQNIVDCILNHGTKDTPTTPTGHVFKICDKFARLHWDYQEMVLLREGRIEYDMWMKTSISKVHHLLLQTPALLAEQNIYLKDGKKLLDRVTFCLNYRAKGKNQDLFY